MRLKLWLVLFAGLGLNNCSPGPAVTVCVFDEPKSGFDCVKYPNVRSFLPLGDGLDLKCTSPDDAERVLKACQNNHVVLPVTLCAINMQGLDFLCIHPDGSQYFLAMSDADNYFCLNDTDRRRLLERCHK